MAEKRIDFSCRYKDYTAEAVLNQLPANEKQMDAIIAFLDYVRQRNDVSVIIRANDERYADDVPQSVMLTKSPEGFYMELNYSRDDWEWNHPLLLANDHLTKDEAISVLSSIFYDCTDDLEIISNGFGEISSNIYTEEDGL